MAKKLTHPKHRAVKIYHAELNKPVKKEDLEKELAKLIPSLNLAKITPSDLQNIIALDAALVDIFQYWHSSPPKEGQGKRNFEYRYAAWVIKKISPLFG